MNYTDCVVFNKSLFRPNEVPFLQADPGKAKRVLNWEAKTKFHRLIEIMYESEKKNLQNKN
jgi:GDPmannose 4,6-dehydratase